MQYGIQVLKQLEEESKQHFEWTRQKSGLLSLLVGISVSCIIGFSSNTSFSWNHIVLTIGYGLLSGALTHYATVALLTWILFKRKVVARAIDEMDFFHRVGDTLGSLMFFIKSSNFEETLKWFSHDHPTDVKNIIAKVVYKQLNRSFEPKQIKLYINSYAEHSKIISEIMEDAKDICFTCIKAPKNWFDELDADNIEHDCLPGFENKPLDFCDRNKLRTRYKSPERVDQYPSHYIKFLKNGSGGSRRRVFLLNADEWGNLVNYDNFDYFLKFMKPCENKVETVFVNIAEMQKKSEAADQDTARIIRDAVEANITREDYDIFEKHALMIYKKISETTHLLEFKVGGKTAEYSNFIDFLFGRTDAKLGIYTPKQIEEIINQNKQKRPPESVGTVAP